MTKLAKRISAAAAATIMALSMTVSVSAAQHIHSYSTVTTTSYFYPGTHTGIMHYVDGKPFYGNYSMSGRRETTTVKCGCGDVLSSKTIHYITHQCTTGEETY